MGQFTSLLRVALMFTVIVLHIIAQQEEGGHTPAPDRPGGDRDHSCPPNPKRAGDGTIGKDAADQARDMDVNSDGRADYFMGEYKFIEGDRDLLVVRVWCINHEPTQDVPATPENEEAYNDFFTFEILTSLRDVEIGEFVETVRVMATSPT
jgi:hypothetical protein